MSDAKPIETFYKGYRFRSRAEARYAVFLDAIGVTWQYEVEGFQMPDGVRYLPDFWLPDLGIFLEVKPKHLWDSKSIYLAGKCGTGWRAGLNLYGHETTGPNAHCDVENHCEAMESKSVLDRSLTGIIQASVVFAWIDAADCYGTLAEIGFAVGLTRGASHRRFVFVGLSTRLRDTMARASGGVYSKNGSEKPHDWESCHDLWFVESLAAKSGWFKTPQDAIDSLTIGKDPVLPKMPIDYQKVNALSKGKERPVCVVYPPDENHNVPAAAVFDRGYVGRFSMDFVFKRPVESGVAAMKAARFEHGESGSA